MLIAATTLIWILLVKCGLALGGGVAAAVQLLRAA